jgi:hypothetical protein
MRIVVTGGNGAELDDRSLTPGKDTRIGPTRFGDWLGHS